MRRCAILHNLKVNCGHGTGCIVVGGKVACNCHSCGGNIIDLLQFEEHSGAWERYRTGNMVLSNYNLSLKVTNP